MITFAGLQSCRGSGTCQTFLPAWSEVPAGNRRVTKGLPPTQKPASRTARPSMLSATLRFQEFQGAGDFELGEEVRAAIDSMLGSESMCGVVAQEAQLAAGIAVEFTGILFQPLPWSPSTLKGMPQEYEKYRASDEYVIINVSPQIMFKAKCFKPSRLCAIYKRVS